jgi:peroxiredoxin Q/BCP
MRTALALCLLAATQAVDLKVGDAAPKFESTDDAGKAWKSDEHVGKKILVVYFFPAAFTGG